MLALLCFAVVMQSVLLAPMAHATAKEEPGMPLQGSHKDLSFRVIRTHANSVENLPTFIAILLLAVVAGVDPTWANWLAGIHVVARLLFWAVYYSGVGKVAGGPRTISFVGGWLTNSILAGMTIFALVN
jgi:uncharacterized MAPEG superfamily protein